jgi:hypothetical protein
MNRIRCGELQTEMINTPSWREDAAAIVTDPNIGFEIESVPEVAGNKLIVRGWLTNPTSRDQTIVVFPVGRLGFLVQFGSPDILTYTGPMFPPQAPPPPMTMIIPAESKVEFTQPIVLRSALPVNTSGGAPPMPMPSAPASPDLLSLDNYDYDGTPIVELRWSFNLWNPPKPAGTIRIALPEQG